MIKPKVRSCPKQNVTNLFANNWERVKISFMWIKLCIHQKK